MKSRSATLRTLAGAAAVAGGIVLSAPAAPASATPAGPASEIVEVGTWAVPALAVRDSPGWPGGQPGNAIGQLKSGDRAVADCFVPDGATVTQWGRTQSDWVKIRWGGTNTGWLWGGGLKPYPILPQC
ncbi:hypothetical protein [Streptomyces fulvoviolaceus]|uniref:hypothetical protein n=1 Tax=Streptomyces fulvoviolaceus TaxID=285535 RepID=UPI0021BFFCE6|nr:hypothetical protein [Streptomyces fulvoviolaceus]MCT9077155.1 hypothetical protein [Streptomyces fulvoviolaceus]